MAQTIAPGVFLNCSQSAEKATFVAVGLADSGDKIKVVNRDSKTFTLPKAQCSVAYPEPVLAKRLSVPYTKQTENKLCGPASLEMLFGFWGITSHDQYQIMHSILRKYRNEGRYKSLKLEDQVKFDPNTYPGTGTTNMRGFLEQFGDVDNGRIKTLPASEAEHNMVRTAFLGAVQSYISQDIPVIVHQNWSMTSTNGHYRIVTGYDHTKQVVYLKDARSGDITQSYTDLFELWNVKGDYLPYNFLAFNTARNKICIPQLP